MNKAQALKTLRKNNFSLLELLVVISILAIIAGTLLTAYDGLQAQAAKSQAANDIASIDRSVRTFTAVEKTAPNNLDSLIQADYSSATSKQLDIDTQALTPATVNASLVARGAKVYLSVLDVDNNGTAGDTSDDTSTQQYIEVTGRNGADSTIDASDILTAANTGGHTFTGVTPAATNVNGNVTRTINPYFFTDTETGSINLAAPSARLLTTMTSKIQGKLQVVNLNAEFASSLTNAGITTVRYADNAGFASNPHATAPASVAGVSWSGSAYAPTTDIPNRIFDVPTTGKNRGRGFEASVVATTPVAIWKPGALGVNSAKVGGAGYESKWSPGSYVASVLVAFGLGNNSTIIGAKNETGNVGDVTIASAPAYGDTQRHEYSRYILLYNLGQAYIDKGGPLTSDSFKLNSSGGIDELVHPVEKAKLVAVVDTRGDFLDEELAEASGQKQ